MAKNYVKLTKQQLTTNYSGVFLYYYILFLFSVLIINLDKDTILISVTVPGWPRHVEKDELSVLGLVQHHFIQLHGRVHAPHVGLVAVFQNCVKK